VLLIQASPFSAGATEREDQIVNPFDFINDPHLLHAVTAHFPVALGILGVPLTIISGIGRKNATLRWVTCICFLLLAGISYGTLTTGQQALSAAPYRLAPEVQALAERHKMLAEYVWIPAVVTAVLVFLCGARSEGLRGALAVLAFFASVVVAIWMGTVACYGTVLVYKHAVGTAGQSPPLKAVVQQPEPVKEVPLPPTVAPQKPPGQIPPPQTPPLAGPPTGSPPPLPAPPPNLPRFRGPPPPPGAANEESYYQNIVSYWKGVARKVWPQK
jgi:uncharacterized membrane protein